MKNNSKIDKDAKILNTSEKPKEQNDIKKAKLNQFDSNKNQINIHQLDPKPAKSSLAEATLSPKSTIKDKSAILKPSHPVSQTVENGRKNKH